jgi:hypothetical protein
MGKYSTRKNETGRRYGRLKVLTFAGAKNRKAMWLCTCKCGQRCIVQGGNLRSGHSTSCGCKGKHGHCRNGRSSRTYTTWTAMKTRCLNKNDPDYAYYGALGVKVCRRWQKSFSAFVCDMGMRPKGMTLDRIRPTGNYTPGNCRWADAKIQGSNKRRRRKKPATVKRRAA